MATKAQVKKVATTKAGGKIDRSKTLLALLEAFGPRSDANLAADLGRVDDTVGEPMDNENISNPAVHRTQWALYQLRRKGTAVKQDSGEWAAV